MFRFWQIANIVLMLAVMPVVLWAAPQKAQKPRTVRVKAAEPVAQPVPPPPPPTLEQMPAQPPQVSYLNGQLTVISRNSTLADILHAVARQTGAVIELPPGAGMERVAGRMGPGAARNVLAELLNGSRYDYVMIASASNPGGLQHVILTPKSPGAETSSPPPPATAYQPPPQQVMPNQDEAPPDATTDEQEIPPEEPSTEESASPQPQPTPAYPQPYTSGNPQVGNPGNPQQPGVKTPEQLLQELQRMQQLQQQQQQQRQNQQQE
jgi:hypothetical protein